LIIEYVKPDCLYTSFKLSTDTIRKDEEFFLELKFNSSGENWLPGNIYNHKIKFRRRIHKTAS